MDRGNAGGKNQHTRRHLRRTGQGLQNDVSRRRAAALRRGLQDRVDKAQGKADRGEDVRQERHISFKKFCETGNFVYLCKQNEKRIHYGYNDNCL